MSLSGMKEFEVLTDDQVNEIKRNIQGYYEGFESAGAVPILLKNGVRPAGYEIIERVGTKQENELYELKPMFWTKAVSRFFTIGLWISVVLLLAYLAALFGAEIDMINLQLMDML